MRSRKARQNDPVNRFENRTRVAKAQRRKVDDFFDCLHPTPYTLTPLSTPLTSRPQSAKRAHPREKRGRLAQLVERLAYTENVGGSSPSSPTKICLRQILSRRSCASNRGGQPSGFGSASRFVE